MKWKYCYGVCFCSFYLMIYFALYIQNIGNDITSTSCLLVNMTKQTDEQGVYKDFLIKISPNEFSNKPDFDINFYELTSHINITEYAEINIITRWPQWSELDIQVNNNYNCLLNNAFNIRYTNVDKHLYKTNYQYPVMTYLRIFGVLFIISILIILWRDDI